MNLAQWLVNEEHTFAAWAEKELAKVLGTAPTIIHVADLVLSYCGPVLQTIVGLEAGAPAAALVGKVIAETQKDLVVVSGLLMDIGPNETVAGMIKAIGDNFNSLLTAGHITGTKSVSLANKVLAEITALLNAVTRQIVPPTTVPVAGGAA